MELKNFWVTFSIPDCLIDDFDYNGPWWCSEGEKEDVEMFFAIRAGSVLAVNEWLTGMFDEGTNFGTVTIDEQDEDWIPFTEEFKRRDCMVWPYRYAGTAEMELSVCGTKIEIGDGEIEMGLGDPSADQIYYSGEIVLFKDMTQDGEVVRCKIEEVAGAAVKIVPLDEETPWAEAVVASEMVSKYEVQYMSRKNRKRKSRNNSSIEKSNQCSGNALGGDNNCRCSGIASKCLHGESVFGKYCRWVKFHHDAPDACMNKKARSDCHQSRVRREGVQIEGGKAEG